MVQSVKARGRLTVFIVLYKLKLVLFGQTTRRQKLVSERKTDRENGKETVLIPDQCCLDQ